MHAASNGIVSGVMNWRRFGMEKSWQYPATFPPFVSRNCGKSPIISMKISCFAGEVRTQHLPNVDEVPYHFTIPFNFAYSNIK
jgi:hypothetical protein